MSSTIQYHHGLANGHYLLVLYAIANWQRAIGEQEDERQVEGCTGAGMPFDRD